MMAVLALRHGQGPVLLREVAKAEAMSEKYLSQIVMPLRSASLLRSVRGARGGYVLAREPGKISVGEIVEVLEGGFDIADTGKNHPNASSVIALVLRRVWRDLSGEIARSLSGITLQDIVRQAHEDGESLVMYNI